MKINDTDICITSFCPNRTWLNKKYEVVPTHPVPDCRWWPTPNLEQRKDVVTIFSVCRSFTYAMSPIPGELMSHPLSPMIMRFFNGRLLLNLNDLNKKSKNRIMNRIHSKDFFDIVGWTVHGINNSFSQSVILGISQSVIIFLYWITA